LSEENKESIQQEMFRREQNRKLSESSMDIRPDFKFHINLRRAVAPKQSKKRLDE